MGSLAKLLAPNSIGVVGGAPAERVVRQCRALGFRGEMFAVHPTRADIGGLRCAPTLDDLGTVPDATFIGVNREATLDAIVTLSAMGPMGGAVCYASGFAEVGEARRQRDLTWAAGDMPFFGPNCYGFVNAFDRVALWPDEHGMRPIESGVAIIAQSGNVGVNLTFQQRGLDLGMMITVGNQASISIEECVAHLLDDERVTAIGIFLEALGDPVRFAAEALRAHQIGKPIVVLQTGRSAVGARIAASHTASMAGHHASYDALFARCGVPRVTTPSELLEALKLLRHGGISGRRVVSLSCSGGEASLVADHIEPLALMAPDFDDDHRTRIAATVTDRVTVTNPFDYHTFMWGDRRAMAACFTQVMDGPQDVTMLVLDAPSSPANDPTAWAVAIDALGDAVQSTNRRGVVVATMAECLSPVLQALAELHGLTPLLGLTEGLRALEAGATWGAGPLSTQVPVLVTAHGEVRIVHEGLAKERLTERGLAVPHGKIAIRAEHVMAVAREVGFPVTLKALGLAHKTESGAVAVGIRTEKDLMTAMNAMPPSDVGYLVEQTVQGAVAEVLVAIRRDHPLGWVVTIGIGGVLTELIDDAVHLLAPVSVDDVLAALSQLRMTQLLHGFRGAPRGDVEALAAFVVAATDAAITANLVELEMNPVLVGAVGRGVVAVDALWVEEATS